MSYLEKDVSDLIQALAESVDEETGEIFDGVHFEENESLSVNGIYGQGFSFLD